MFRLVEYCLLPSGLGLVHGCEFFRQKLANNNHSQVCDVQIGEVTLQSAPFFSCLTVIIGRPLVFARLVFEKPNDLLLLPSFMACLISPQLLVVG